MSVASQENKQMLADLMVNIMNDNNIVITDKTLLYKFIEEQCNYYHGKRFEFEGIQEINKKIVGLCYNFVLMNKNTKSQTNSNAHQIEKVSNAIFNNSIDDENLFNINKSICCSNHEIDNVR